ncbi:MAG: YlmC/YmxH family sporulation protein [Candidatus Improbicoccus pseudotrichonymphae]|uniref:YlmC/YmxH family sporulation protein n=1 Tax=Candidatus Improbicoccus pseudotrichonymphae TaxID=3033792 RepID=A0AA48HVM2_9FIRM|nr:MAG: YlmC/YmxH family sporulation protein [Candidatus Improbicoccus pseudotrichonymphae]
MICGIADLRKKEVINVRDGLRIGFVGDIEIDLCNARLVSIIIYGHLKFFGILGREDDIVIRWEYIEVIGKDTILVNFYQTKERRRKSFFSKFTK